MNRNRLRGLYAITDERLIPEASFAAIVEQALAGGAAVVQYRDKSSDAAKRLKQASGLRALCDQYSALLIINDDIELAKNVGADGIHLGEHDASVDQARAVLEDNTLIGVSCYNELDRAIAAQAAGADYVAFGAVFTSPTKPHARAASCELIREAARKLDIPVCAIGGIDETNAASVVAAGADMIALISGLFAAKDVRRTAETVARLFD